MAISEFCCSLHVPNITNHLTTEGVCFLLQTNKFRKTGSLVFRTMLCYKSNCSNTPFCKGQTILWTWQICGSNCFYHAQFRPVTTGHSDRTGSHRTYLSLYPVTSTVSPVQAIMIHCDDTMNSRNATTSTASDAK